MKKLLFSILVLSLIIVSCNNSNTKTAQGEGDALKGDLPIQGSSTVYPLTAAIAEEFSGVYPKVSVGVTSSGSSAGIKALMAGQVNVANSSRRMKDEELAKCKETGIDILELQVGYDGISIVAAKTNPLTNITLDELKKMWNADAEGKVMKFSDVNPAWQKETMKLYGPSTESGTYEYFTEHVLATKGKSRMDYNGTEDDNGAINNIYTDKGALGYLGLSYYLNNTDKLKVLKVNGVEPSMASVLDKTYPISRPIFIYVNRGAMKKDKVIETFVKFYLDKLNNVAKNVTMIGLSDAELEAQKAKLK